MVSSVQGFSLTQTQYTFSAGDCTEERDEGANSVDDQIVSSAQALAAVAAVVPEDEEELELVVVALPHAPLCYQVQVRPEEEAGAGHGDRREQGTQTRPVSLRVLAPQVQPRATQVVPRCRSVSSQTSIADWHPGVSVTSEFVLPAAYRSLVHRQRVRAQRARRLSIASDARAARLQGEAREREARQRPTCARPPRRIVVEAEVHRPRGYGAYGPDPPYEAPRTVVPLVANPPDRTRSQTRGKACMVLHVRMVARMLHVACRMLHMSLRKVRRPKIMEFILCPIQL